MRSLIAKFNEWRAEQKRSAARQRELRHRAEREKATATVVVQFYDRDEYVRTYSRTGRWDHIGGSLYVWSAEDRARATFDRYAEDAGKNGLKIEDVYYPPHRIRSITLHRITITDINE